MRKRMKVTSGGQISIPATVRRRWRTSEVVVSDEGDRLVIEPARGELIDEAAGSLRGYLAGAELDALRRQARAEEAEADARKLEA